MKVCMLVRTNFIGDRRVRKEAKTLADNGYQVSVVAYRNWSRREKVSGSKIQYIDGIKVIYVNNRVFKIRPAILNLILNLLFRNFFDNFTIARYATAEKADIYHSHDLDTLLEGFIAAKINKAKQIFDSHEYFTEFSKSFLSLYWKLVQRLLISKVNGVIAVCDNLANMLSEKYGIPKPIILLNCAELKPYKKYDLIRSEFNIPSNQKIVLYLGSLFPGRGVETVIDSVKYIDKDVTVVIIGSAHESYRRQLEERVNKMRATSGSNIIISGPVPFDKVYDYMMSADLGIAFYEETSVANDGLPNKLFDYMISGLPVVASAMSEIKKVIEETKTGIVIDKADAERLGTTIQKLIHDDQTLELFHKNALESAKNNYNWGIESKKLLKLYNEI